MKNSQFISEYSDKIGVYEAKKKTNGNLFFEGGVIYSYGYHYPLLFKVTTKSGKDLVFVNTRGYSSTTARHINHARSYAYHGVDLGYNKDGDYNHLPFKELGQRTANLDTVISCLNKELKYLSDKHDALSTKAWKQRENLTKDIMKIERALLDINY